MEALIIILPLIITVGNCGLSCYCYNRANNRIAILERSLDSYINSHRVSYTPVAPPASAPPASPGYGYQYYPEEQRII
jgi:hypothetical protein